MDVAAINVLIKSTKYFTKQWEGGEKRDSRIFLFENLILGIIFHKIISVLLSEREDRQK